MEATARNVDRLVTVQMRGGGRPDRYIIPPLYESASKKLNNQPVSLVAATRLVDLVKPRDTVLLVSDFGTPLFVPFGETDGPSGVASLARALSFGLKAIPIIVSGDAIESVRFSTKAAGVNLMDFDLAKETTSAAGVSIVFPRGDDAQSEKSAATLISQFSPKAVISIETPGPNRKGVKHFAAGTDAETKYRLPAMEHLFYEAKKRGILTIGIIDVGNEIGSGTIEEAIRKVTPYGDICRCGCQQGIACAVETDIVFPANISNWGAYAISAMLAFLLRQEDLLQDAYTERRMLEACVMAGAVDGVSGRGILAVDSVNHEAHEAVVTLLHTIIGNALNDLTLSRYVTK